MYLRVEQISMHKLFFIYTCVCVCVCDVRAHVYLRLYINIYSQYEKCLKQNLHSLIKLCIKS
jgi:hypothetical protein